jgi:hypothetical protein
MIVLLTIYTIYDTIIGGYTWSRQGKILPRDLSANQQFGQRISLHGDTVVISAKNDDYNGIQSGSAYVFQRKLLILIFNNKYYEYCFHIIFLYLLKTDICFFL